MLATSVNVLSQRKQDLCPNADLLPDVAMYAPSNELRNVLSICKAQLSGDLHWSLDSKKLRSRLHELEDLMASSACLSCFAPNTSLVCMLFANLNFCWLELSGHNIHSITIDKSLVTRLGAGSSGKPSSAGGKGGVGAQEKVLSPHGRPSNMEAYALSAGPCSAVVQRSFIAITYADEPVIYIVFCGDLSVRRSESEKKAPLYGLVGFNGDLPVQKVSLPAVDGRFFPRRLSCTKASYRRVSKIASTARESGRSKSAQPSGSADSSETFLVLIWWSLAVGQHHKATTWTPSVANNHANVHLLEVAPGLIMAGGGEQPVSSIASTRTDQHIVAMEAVSLTTGLDVFSIEESPGPNGQTHCHLSHYRLSGDSVTLVRFSHITLALNGPVTTWCRNDSRTRIVLGCRDQSLIVFDTCTQASRLVRVDFVPLSFNWPNNAQYSHVRELVHVVSCENVFLCYGIRCAGGRQLDLVAGGGVLAAFDLALNRVPLFRSADTLAAFNAVTGFPLDSSALEKSSGIRPGSRSPAGAPYVPTLDFDKIFRPSHSSVDHIVWMPVVSTNWLSDEVQVHSGGVPGLSPKPAARVLVKFARGPLVSLSLASGSPFRAVSRCHLLLSLTDLVDNFLSREQIAEALSLLMALEWNRQAEACFLCLTRICNHLFKLPELSNEIELCLELALGHFYSPRNQVIDESVVLQYRDRVIAYARRFFMTLLRASRFEKAYLLAIDIGAADLFVDLYHEAVGRKELALASACKSKAQELVRQLNRFKQQQEQQRRAAAAAAAAAASAAGGHFQGSSVATTAGSFPAPPADFGPFYSSDEEDGLGPHDDDDDDERTEVASVEEDEVSLLNRRSVAANHQLHMVDIVHHRPAPAVPTQVAPPVPPRRSAGAAGRSAPASAGVSGPSAGVKVVPLGQV